MAVVFLNCRYKFYSSFSFLIMTWDFSFLGSFESSISSFCFVAQTFSKNLRKIASSLMPRNDEKHIFAILLSYIIWHVHVRVSQSGGWVVFMPKIPSFIPKNKLKLSTCIWTPMTWPGALESNLPFKVVPRNC